MREIVYLNRDNVVDLQLQADGAAADLTPVSRMTLTLDGSTTIDSSTSPAAFDWSGGNGQLILSLGGESIAPGRYTAELVVYDAVNTQGIVWGAFDLAVM